MRKIRWPIVALVLTCWLPLAISAAWPAMWQWSKTSATNATADPTINWREGQPPSSVNDSARAMMAAVASYRDDISGSLVTGGTSTAYTLSSNSAYGSLANLDGAKICFSPHTTNGAIVTLSIDGLSARPLRSSPSLEIGAGVLVQGTPYCVTYKNADLAFYLQSFYGSAFVVPLGTVLDYTGDTAPNTNFAIADGSCISRTTFASYFALIGTRFSTCDGVSTFGLPDLRGRVVAGQDNMGAGAANRLTNAANGCGVAFTSVGVVCGSESQTLTIAQMPAHDHGGQATGTLQFNAHTRGIGTATGGVEVPVRLDSATTPDSNWFVSGTNGFGGTAAPSDPRTIASQGGGTAHPIVQPTFSMKKIVRVL